MNKLNLQEKTNLKEFGMLVGSIMAYHWYLDSSRRSLEDENPAKNPNDRHYQSGINNEGFQQAIAVGRVLGAKLEQWPFPNYEIQRDLEVDKAHLEFFPAFDMDSIPIYIISDAYGIHAGRLEEFLYREASRTRYSEPLSVFTDAIRDGRSDYTIARRKITGIVDPRTWDIDFDQWFEILGYHGPSFQTVDEETHKALFPE